MTIKVLQYICPTGLFGAEMWILVLAKNLKKNHVNCHLAVNLESSVQDIEIVNRYRALGLPAHIIKMKGRFDASAIVKLVRLIKREKIEIIHTHGYKSDLIGLAAARITGIKALTTPHGFENSNDFKLRSYMSLGCMSFRFFDRVVPLSDALQADVEKMRVKKDRICLIQNGVDIEEIDFCTNSYNVFRPSQDIFRKIGYVGQLIIRKNLFDLLDTFELLYRDHKNVILELVGDGPMRGRLEGHAAGLTAHENIRFLGYRTDRLDVVKQWDLFSMTSSLEGIPRCMMEAMAIGLPVAAYDIPGVDQLIVHNKTGLAAKFGDVENLKGCWEKLLFDKNFAAEISRTGRRFVRNHFSGGRMAKEYFGLYQKVLQNV